MLCMSATAGSLIQLRLIPLEPTGSRSTVCDGTGGEHLLKKYGWPKTSVSHLYYLV